MIPIVLAVAGISTGAALVKKYFPREEKVVAVKRKKRREVRLSDWKTEIMLEIRNRGLDQVMKDEMACISSEFLDPAETAKLFDVYSMLHEKIHKVSGNHVMIGISIVSAMHLSVRQHYEPELKQNYEQLIAVIPSMVSSVLSKRQEDYYDGMSACSTLIQYIKRGGCENGTRYQNSV